ncbi:MAG TPA: hypothetical protein VKR32_11510 [Puia sp.]|nr:hypothetical protein [Puia sp.]
MSLNMNLSNLKQGLLLLLMFSSFTLKAQNRMKDITDISQYDLYDDENGKRVERVQFTSDDKIYFVVFVGDSMIKLTIDGEKVPPANWGKYADLISSVRQKMKEQEKKNREQARLNEIQAAKNREQSRRNEIQEEKNREQVRLNEIQVEKNIEQAKRNEEQQRLNVEQVKRNEEQVEKNRQQEKENEEQVKLNEIQAAKNQEQARLNEIQAEKNKAQAKLMEKMEKDLTSDLISDKIISSGSELRECMIDDDEMKVNGVRQPEDVFKKYHEKYLSGQYGLNSGMIRFNKNGLRVEN